MCLIEKYLLTCLKVARTLDITWSNLGQELAISTLTRVNEPFTDESLGPRYQMVGYAIARYTYWRYSAALIQQIHDGTIESDSLLVLLIPSHVYNHFGSNQ
jgi:hypothetical protein